jgi:hypothetical protein
MTDIERPYVDDCLALVKTRRRLAALRLAAEHELVLTPGIPDIRGTFTYEPTLGDLELVDPDLTGALRDLALHRYLTSTAERAGEYDAALDRPTSLLVNDKGRAALDRWSRSETRPRKSRRKA